MHTFPAIFFSSFSFYPFCPLLIIQNKPERIAGFTVHPDFVVQMRAGGAAGGANQADEVPAFDFLPDFHFDGGKMPI